MPNADIWSKVEAVHQFVKREGNVSEKLRDAYEYEDIRTIVADGGYGLKVVTDTFCVWAEYATRDSGFMRGTEIELDELLVKLGIVA